MHWFIFVSPNLTFSLRWYSRTCDYPILAWIVNCYRNIFVNFLFPPILSISASSVFCIAVWDPPSLLHLLLLSLSLQPIVQVRSAQPDISLSGSWRFSINVVKGHSSFNTLMLLTKCKFFMCDIFHHNNQISYVYYDNIFQKILYSKAPCKFLFKYIDKYDFLLKNSSEVRTE